MSKIVAIAELHPLMAETLQNDGKVILTITGTSMLPLLRHKKDRACLMKPQEQPLKKYDLPLFVREDGKYILHRIVKVTPDGYEVTGDNQGVTEYPVRHSQVIGVVQGVFRGGVYNLLRRLFIPDLQQALGIRISPSAAVFKRKTVFAPGSQALKIPQWRLEK